MPAADYPWTIEQGARTTFDFALKNPDGSPRDTTGLLGRGQVRPGPGSAKLVGNLLVEVLDHTAGSWRVTCTPAALASYGFGQRKSATDRVTCHYDIELYDPDDPTYVDRVIQGEARISVEVTK